MVKYYIEIWSLPSYYIYILERCFVIYDWIILYRASHSDLVSFAIIYTFIMFQYIVNEENSEILDN